MSNWQKVMGPFVALALLLSMLPAAALAYNPVTCVPTTGNPGFTSVTFKARNSDGTVGSAITTIKPNVQFFIEGVYTDLTETAAASAVNTVDQGLILYLLLRHSNGNWIVLYVESASPDVGTNAATAGTGTFTATAFHSIGAANGTVEANEAQVIVAAGAVIDGTEKAANGALADTAVVALSATTDNNVARPALAAHGVSVTAPATATAAAAQVKTITVRYRVAIGAGQPAFPIGTLNVSGAAEDANTFPAAGIVGANAASCHQYQTTTQLTITDDSPVAVSVAPNTGTIFTGTAYPFGVRMTDANGDLRGINLTFVKTNGDWVFIGYRAGVTDNAGANFLRAPEFVEQVDPGAIAGRAQNTDLVGYWTYQESTGITQESTADDTGTYGGVFANFAEPASTVNGSGSDATIVFNVTFTASFTGNNVNVYVGGSDFHGGLAMGAVLGTVNISRP